MRCWCQNRVTLKSPSSTEIKSRYASSRVSTLLALLIVGCTASPVGPAPPAPRTTSGLYFFSSPGAIVRMVITAGPAAGPGVIGVGSVITFTADPSLDDFDRPGTVDPSWVAFSTGQVGFTSNTTYEAELQRPGMVPGTWNRVDDIDPWVPNLREWYRLDP